MQWFKKHPEFLMQESTALSNDSNYRELYQFRDNLFISSGNIVVRLNEAHRYPILIVYTDATPYRLPLIFPLKKVLKKDEIEKLAALSLDEVLAQVKPHVQYYYHLRHQNSSGELCTLERDNLDKGSTFFGITTVLERVRNWCAGHVTNNYPLDSEEVDFCSHFNFINNEIQLLYPEHFFDESLIEGDCYSILFTQLPGLQRTRYIYSGAFLDGVNKSGIIEQANVNIERHFLHPKLKTSTDIYTKSELVTRLISERKILKAHWFHVNHEPKPFESLKDLIAIIGNGNYENGIKRMTKRCLGSFATIPDSFLIGIRFSNRKALYEFQMFKAYETIETPYIIQPTEETKMRSILERYGKIEAIVGEKLTEVTYHQRNGKRADHQILKKKSINLFGVGAIGSEVADCMAKAGTGKLILYDEQILKGHNPVRHLAGFENLGEPKVNAVARILHFHNPFIEVKLMPLNLYNLDPAYHLNGDSFTISSVADDNVEGFVNQQLVIANLPSFYIRALRGGKMARIFRVIPGKDACFNCLTLYRNEEKHFIEIPEDPDYPTLKNECNNPIRPASAADLKFIAAFASRLIIEELQNGHGSNNHWIWSSEVLENSPIHTPNHVYAQNLAPHPNCAFCHHDRLNSVTISKSVVAFMQQLISQNPKIETGGVMAGSRDEHGNVKIAHASGPGPKATQSEMKFEKDVQYCQQFLDNLYIESNQKAVYVGEWHSHPSINNTPSGMDVKSLSEIATQKNYLTECPAMIIYSNTGVPSCTLHPAGKRYYFTDLKIVN